jgi:hypothetical protein
VGERHVRRPNGPTVCRAKGLGSRAHTRCGGVALRAVWPEKSQFGVAEASAWPTGLSGVEVLFGSRCGRHVVIVERGATTTPRGAAPPLTMSRPVLQTERRLAPKRCSEIGRSRPSLRHCDGRCPAMARASGLATVKTLPFTWNMAPIVDCELVCSPSTRRYDGPLMSGPTLSSTTRSGPFVPALVQ